jgi:hypothetical protein
VPRDLRRRVQILRDLGVAGLRWEEAGWLRHLVTDRVTLGGPTGFYAQLAAASCFADDPLAKKPRVLAHQLARLGLIDMADPRSLAPAIDYHLIRLYLRTGRVRAANFEMTERLRSELPVRLPQITRLRRAVEEAMWYTAEGAELRMDWLNHVEWQLARAFCTREIPRCHQLPLERKPLDRVARKVVGPSLRCPLSQRCAAQDEPELADLLEPKLRASYY